MAIYTKTGDTGSTSTLSGNRVLKSDSLIEVQGQVDELNSNIGYLNSILALNQNIKFPIKKDICSFLEEIQHNLFVIGVDISLEFKDNKLTENCIADLENSIDDMTNSMLKQTHFILYSGTTEATYCHVVRAVTRRCERAFVRLLNEKNLEANIGYKYINRLSDYFFTLSRYLNHLSGKSETIMKL